MPLYEYECGQCRNRFEVRQGFEAAPEAACPQCRSQARRVFYPTAVVFKGSGFYITDHRKNKGETTPEAPVSKPVEKKEATAAEKPGT
ncbi:MAG: FmdB family zinc ribbon protein [Chloroflexota bacterium]